MAEPALLLEEEKKGKLSDLLIRPEILGSEIASDLHFLSKGKSAPLEKPYREDLAELFDILGCEYQKADFERFNTGKTPRFSGRFSQLPTIDEDARAQLSVFIEKYGVEGIADKIVDFAEGRFFVISGMVDPKQTIPMKELEKLTEYGVYPVILEDGQFMLYNKSGSLMQELANRGVSFQAAPDGSFTVTNNVYLAPSMPGPTLRKLRDALQKAQKLVEKGETERALYIHRTVQKIVSSYSLLTLYSQTEAEMKKYRISGKFEDALKVERQQLERALGIPYSQYKKTGFGKLGNLFIKKAKENLRKSIAGYETALRTFLSPLTQKKKKSGMKKFEEGDSLGFFAEQEAFKAGVMISHYEIMRRMRKEGMKSTMNADGIRGKKAKKALKMKGKEQQLITALENREKAIAFYELLAQISSFTRDEKTLKKCEAELKRLQSDEFSKHQKLYEMAGNLEFLILGSKDEYYAGMVNKLEFMKEVFGDLEDFEVVTQYMVLEDTAKMLHDYAKKIGMAVEPFEDLNSVLALSSYLSTTMEKIIKNYDPKKLTDKLESDLIQVYIRVNAAFSLTWRAQSTSLSSMRVREKNPEKKKRLRQLSQALTENALMGLDVIASSFPEGHEMKRKIDETRRKLMLSKEKGGISVPEAAIDYENAVDGYAKSIFENAVLDASVKLETIKDALQSDELSWGHKGMIFTFLKAYAEKFGEEFPGSTMFEQLGEEEALPVYWIEELSKMLENATYEKGSIYALHPAASVYDKFKGNNFNETEKIISLVGTINALHKLVWPYRLKVLSQQSFSELRAAPQKGKKEYVTVKVPTTWGPFRVHKVMRLEKGKVPETAADSELRWRLKELIMDAETSLEFIKEREEALGMELSYTTTRLATDEKLPKYLFDLIEKRKPLDEMNDQQLRKYLSKILSRGYAEYADVFWREYTTEVAEHALEVGEFTALEKFGYKSIMWLDEWADTILWASFAAGAVSGVFTSGGTTSEAQALAAREAAALGVRSLVRKYGLKYLSRKAFQNVLRKSMWRITKDAIKGGMRTVGFGGKFVAAVAAAPMMTSVYGYLSAEDGYREKISREIFGSTIHHFAKGLLHVYGGTAGKSAAFAKGANVTFDLMFSAAFAFEGYTIINKMMGDEEITFEDKFLLGQDIFFTALFAYTIGKYARGLRGPNHLAKMRVNLLPQRAPSIAGNIFLSGLFLGEHVVIDELKDSMFESSLRTYFPEEMRGPMRDFRNSWRRYPPGSMPIGTAGARFIDLETTFVPRVVPKKLK